MRSAQAGCPRTTPRYRKVRVVAAIRQLRLRWNCPTAPGASPERDELSGVVGGAVWPTPTFYINSARYDGSYETDELVAALVQAGPEGG